MDQTIQRRITRRIAVIVGAFALGVMAMYGLIASLERRNDVMRAHRADVREIFRLVTLFQGDFDRMVRTLGVVGAESQLFNAEAFLAAQEAARQHLTDLRRTDIESVAPAWQSVPATFDAYATAANTMMDEAKLLGLTATAAGQATEMAKARDRMEKVALNIGDRAMLAGFAALSRGQFRFIRDRILNEPSEVARANTGDREGLLRALDELGAVARDGSMAEADKKEFAAGAAAYRVAVNSMYEATARRSAALVALSAAQGAMAQNIVALRQALFAQNDVVYAQEEEYRTVSRNSVGAAVILLSLGFIFLIMVMGGRFRREAFLEQDRAKIFKDFALSSRSVSWETDASCRYTRRETSGMLDDSVPGQLGRPMIEAETAPNIEFEGPTAFDMVGGRLPYRDILFTHTGESGQQTWWRSSGTPYYDVGGKFLGYRGITLDVTETKSYERAVADAVARSRDFAAASSDERWEIDGNGVVRALESQSPFADEMRRICLGRRFSELTVTAEAQTEAGDPLDRYIDLRQPFRDLVYSGLDLRSGAREWFRMSGVPFFDSRTGSMGMRCVNTRITATRLLELENRERQRQLEALVSDLPIIVQRGRPGGPTGVEGVYVSPGIESILGIPTDSMLGPNAQVHFIRTTGTSRWKPCATPSPWGKTTKSPTGRGRRREPTRPYRAAGGW